MARKSFESFHQFPSSNLCTAFEPPDENSVQHKNLRKSDALPKHSWKRRRQTSLKLEIVRKAIACDRQPQRSGMFGFKRIPLGAKCAVGELEGRSTFACFQTGCLSPWQPSARLPQMRNAKSLRFSCRRRFPLRI